MIKKIPIVILVACGMWLSWDLTGYFNREQLAMLLGICFGFLAGVPLVISLLGPSRSRKINQPDMWIEVDEKWEKLDRF